MAGQQPQVDVYRVPVRWAAPQAISLARVLGWLFGKAIAGDNGAIRYGGPGDIQANRTAFKGYAFPAQMFTGYSATRVAGGRARVAHPSFPATGSARPDTVLQSPLNRAMEAVTAAQRVNLPSTWTGPSDAS